MQYAPFISDIELPFYTALASHKINHDKLDDSARKILGLYELRPTDIPDNSCRMQIHGNALRSDDSVPNGYYRAEGIIKNVNTIEEYKKLDKPAVLQRAGRIIWEAINDGTIYSCPSLLSSFSVVSYADLKRYKFTYWFAFPALHSDPPWIPENKAEPLRLTGHETTNLVDRVQTWRYSVDARQHGFFLAKRVRKAYSDESQGHEDHEYHEDWEDHGDSTTPTTSHNFGSSYRWEVSSLASYETGFFDDVAVEDRFVAFADPSTYPTSPGWMVRNLLVMIQHRWKLNKVRILCYRDIQSRRDDARSIILDVVAGNGSLQPGSKRNDPSQMPKVTGWERNKEGKLASRMASLSEYLDPTRLADQSVDLNLKLMRWRIAPDLDLEKIKNTKCLLLGAGTLGSYVARNLLGWGVRKITFVDNANVSFSNPVRQPLFDFKDCLEGGAKKAYRAAEALREIYPGVDSTGFVMSVPMAGHPITDEKKVKTDFETLKALVDKHDAIFLLMDTRESRWLPTVMGKTEGKIVLNAALGFDTFVAMRHGVCSAFEDGEELGCYFCNDVVAPADSIKDQTLDQQCTVTRPGIAAIASAMLVEIFVSILQHPLGAAAPGANSTHEDRGQHPLGIIPHQIRGFLHNFQNIVVKGRSYDCCSACSSKILQAYRENGFEFVKQALNEKGFVEELSGLAEVQRAAEAAQDEIEWEEDEEVDDVDVEGEMV